jgi:hypothetical protein
VPADGSVMLAPPVVKDAVAGEMLPPFELNATEYVEPAQRAYSIVFSVGMKGEETVFPVSVFDQPKNV